MPTHKPIRLSSLLEGSDTALAQVVGKASYFQDLTKSIRRSLPAEVAPHLIGTALHDKQLVLIADSAVWAARLRFLAADLLTELEREKGPGAHSVKVKVGAPTRPSDAP